VKRFLSLLLRPLAFWDRTRGSGCLHNLPTHEWQQAVSLNEEQEFKRLLLTLPDIPPSSGDDEDLNAYEQAHLLNAVCPDCYSPNLLGGPCGGYAQNVLCRDCYSEFNRSPVRSSRIGARHGGRLSVYGIVKA